MFKLNAIATALILLSSSAVMANDATELDLTDELAQTLAVNTAPTLPGAAPTAKETFARSAQTWLTRINKPYANQLASGNGSGVMVGVVDTGINMSNTMVSNRVVATYNGTTGTTNVTDTQGHGTHVAGIVAGNTTNGALLEGVAPGTSLLIAKVFENGYVTAFSVSRGIDWAVNIHRAPIVTMSLGFNAPAITGSVQNAVNKGTLITAAMGNTGTQGAAWPAAYAKESWAKGQIIAVGALDANNRKASFSTWDPSLANWVVYAPGVGILSSYGTGYSSLSGTSMATPMVAGQASLIKSNWNFLPAADIAQIIFQSADRICNDAVSAATCAARKTPDAVYGWGKINVGASLQPIGPLTLQNSPSTVVNFAGTSLASPKSGLSAGVASLRSIAVDKFKRGFTVQVGATATGTTGTVSATPSTGATSTTVGSAKLMAEYTNVPTLPGQEGLAMTTTLAKMSYSSETNGKAVGFGTGGTTDQFFGLNSTGLAPLSLSGKTSSFNSPYLGFSERAQHVGYSFKMADGSVVRMGSVNQNPEVDAAMFGAAAARDNTNVVTAELQKSFGDTTAVFTAGQMTEQNAALGMSGAGALAINNTASTTFLSVAMARPVAERVTASAMFSVGNTAGYKNSAASLIDGATDSTSAAWSMGLARSDMFRTGDRLGLTVAMPLRVMTGSMQVTTATGQSQEDGSLSYSTESIALAPSGMQKNIELAYTRPAQFGGTVSAMAVVKLDPGHVAGAPAQYGVGVKYQTRF